MQLFRSNISILVISLLTIILIEWRWKKISKYVSKMNTFSTGFAVPFHCLFKFIKHFVQSITMKYSYKKETEGIFLQSLILIANLYPVSGHSHSDRIKAALYQNEPISTVTYSIVVFTHIGITIHVLNLIN